MENNENKKHDKKPYFKHRRKPGHNGERRDNQSPAGEQNGENITVRPGRYDLPPTERSGENRITFNNSGAERKEHDTVSGSNGGANRNQGRHQRHKQSAASDRTQADGISVQNTHISSEHTKDSSGERSDNRHRSRRKNRPYRNKPRELDQTAAEEVKTDTPAADTENEDVPEVITTEYVTTAGSLDAEIIDELNSVSSAEADILEAEEQVPASEEEAELAKYEIVGIRFKAGGKIYYFDPAGNKIPKGTPVVVETSRGPEYGICDIPNRTVTEREVVLPLRTVTRFATAEDTARHEANTAKEQEAFAICSQKILDHNLGMKLIDVEYAFDGSKLLFYFTAEGRVDFRELVKDLASVFRTRIELRQIGIRDETKLLGGIGICGRPFCCKTFLSDFVQVSIKMAKEQNLSLNSVKISGACGRLMCCLRYEYDVYQEEIKKTPKVDQIVSTPDGDGTVIEVQPLAGLVRVRFGTKAEMLTPKVYHRDEVKVIGGKGVKPQEKPSVEN